MPLAQLLGSLTAGELHRVLDFVPDGVVLFSIDTGVILQANAALARMLGHPAGLEGQNIFSMVVSRERTAAVERLPTIAVGEESFTVRTLIHTSGAEVETEISAIRLSDTIICSVVRDVTAHNAAERERTRTLTQLRAAVEASLDSWVVLESVRDSTGVIADFRYADLNARAASVTGHAADDLRGQSVAERLPDAQRYIAVYARVAESGQRLIEEFSVAGPSGVRWIHHEVVPMANGVAIIARDVTEKRLRDEVLRESEERFRSATEHSAIGLGLVGLDGRWLSVNPAICRIVGYSAHELMTLSFQDITHPDDLALDLTYVGQLLRGELSTYQMEKRYLHKQGHIVWARLTVSLVHNSEGTPLYFISQIQDITEQRHLAERLRHAEKMEAVGRLAAGIAHDFNNVLAAIRSNAELLQHTSTSSTDTEDLQAIISDTDRAARMTRQLLLFSQQQVSNPSVIQVSHVVSDMVPMLERLLGRRAELALDLHDGAVRGDPDQIQQVLLNLTVNARDAMPEGGTIWISTDERSLSDPLMHRHGVVPAGMYTVLSVADTGGGMSDEVLTRLFEPFFTTKGAAGSGIGLATVHGIMTHHGGAITVTTVPGTGSRFDAYFPALPIADAASTPPPSRSTEATRAGTTGVAEPESGHAHSIVVVDDQRSLLEVTRRTLVQLGYTAVALPSADAAIEYLNGLAPDRLPDAILTDVEMPGMNGRQFGDLVARRWPSIQVAYMSGYAADDVLREGVLGQTRRFLSKPFTRESLREVIEALLAQG